MSQSGTFQILLYHHSLHARNSRDNLENGSNPVLEKQNSDDKLSSESVKNDNGLKRDENYDNSDDDDDSDAWMSSEDVFTTLSSPFYQSAAEDEDELNGVKSWFVLEVSLDFKPSLSCFLSQERRRSSSI